MNSILKNHNSHELQLQPLQYGFLQQSFVFACSYPKANNEIHHGPKYKVYVLATCK